MKLGPGERPAVEVEMNIGNVFVGQWDDSAGANSRRRAELVRFHFGSDPRTNDAEEWPRFKRAESIGQIQFSFVDIHTQPFRGDVALANVNACVRRNHVAVRKLEASLKV